MQPEHWLRGVELRFDCSERFASATCKSLEQIEKHLNALNDRLEKLEAGKE